MHVFIASVSPPHERKKKEYTDGFGGDSGRYPIRLHLPGRRRGRARFLRRRRHSPPMRSLAWVSRLPEAEHG